MLQICEFPANLYGKTCEVWIKKGVAIVIENKVFIVLINK